MTRYRLPSVALLAFFGTVGVLLPVLAQKSESDFHFLFAGSRDYSTVEIPGRMVTTGSTHGILTITQSFHRELGGLFDSLASLTFSPGLDSFQDSVLPFDGFDDQRAALAEFHADG